MPSTEALARLAKAETLASESQRIAGVGTWHVDVSSGFVVWSDELYRMYGRSPETFIPSAEAFLGIVHPDDRAEMLAAIEETAKGAPMDLLHRVIRPDGEVRHIHSRAQLIVLEKDGPTVMLGTAQDLTERWKADRQIEAQTAELRELQTELIYFARQSAMGTMAATLAHELNQPLAAITNYAEGLLSMRPSPEEMSYGVGEILKNSERAADIIRQLRVMTKRGARDQSLLDLNSVINDAVRMLEGSACWTNKLECRFGGNYSAKADPTQIGQVVINLLKNACEAVVGQSSPSILLETAMVDDQVRVSVSDNGCGIDPEVFSRLFERRVSTKTRGTGVGLSICRTIVESYGGKIDARNLPQGGACFSFTLPCSASPREPAP